MAFGLELARWLLGWTCKVKPWCTAEHLSFFDLGGTLPCWIASLISSIKSSLREVNFCVASGKNLREAGAVLKESCILMMWHLTLVSDKLRHIQLWLGNFGFSDRRSQANGKDKGESIQQAMPLVHAAQQVSSVQNLSRAQDGEWNVWRDFTGSLRGVAVGR